MLPSLLRYQSKQNKARKNYVLPGLALVLTGSTVESGKRKHKWSMVNGERAIRPNHAANAPTSTGSQCAMRHAPPCVTTAPRQNWGRGAAPPRGVGGSAPAKKIGKDTHFGFDRLSHRRKTRPPQANARRHIAAMKPTPQSYRRPVCSTLRWQPRHHRLRCAHECAGWWTPQA